MTFNEANSVRDLVRDRLAATGAGWNFVPGPQLDRTEQQVLIESDVRDALIRLNPAIAANPNHADRVLYELNGLVRSVASAGLVKANEDFRNWLLGAMSGAFGPDHEHVPVQLINFDDLSKNRYVVSTEVTFRHGVVERRFDLVLWVNGIPLVVGETKSATRTAVTWVDAAYDIHHDYENNATAFFVPNAYSFATEGKELHFGSVRMPEHLWTPWKTGPQPGAEGYAGPLEAVGAAVRELLSPVVCVDILANYTVYATDREHRKIKVVCRQQQYRAGNRIVDRVLAGLPRKGLIWHFQGSGKSLTMLFAAQRLRNHAQLGAPTVLIVVDRIDLDTQITTTFNAADVPNVVTMNDGEALLDALRSGQRKIIITTIFKFRDAPPKLSDRGDIICLVDEAHRTQEGDLGQRMRDALPNAFLFGMTGTPINTRDRNTFRTFGAEIDPGHYLDRYSQADSLEDGTTLPLHFHPRPTEFNLDPEMINAKFDELAGELDKVDREKLTSRAARMERFFKSSKRIGMVCKNIAEHFTTSVEPKGFKGLVVTYDKETCGLYKVELDKLLGEDATDVVISGGEGTPASVRRFVRTKEQQDRLLERYEDPDDPLKILIVTAKLLTGFDAPILQTMYLDKVIKDHTLLQAVCRVNRPYELRGQIKTHGSIVDYVGVFQKLERALQFDEVEMQQAVTSINALVEELPSALRACLAYFPGVDRGLEGHAGLIEAQRLLADPAVRDMFVEGYGRLARIWEALAPDPRLTDSRDDFAWLTAVYNSVRPSDTSGRTVWRHLGTKTLELIDEHLRVDAVRDDLDTLVLDAEVVRRMEEEPERHVRRLQDSIGARIRLRSSNARFQSLGEKLEQLRRSFEDGQITSLVYLARLRDIASATVDLEQTLDFGQEALADLFKQAGEQAEGVVADIDDVVKKARWDGWQDSTEGDRKVRQALRAALLKYGLHRNDELFERTHELLRQHY